MLKILKKYRIKCKFRRTTEKMFNFAVKKKYFGVYFWPTANLQENGKDYYTSSYIYFCSFSCSFLCRYLQKPSVKYKW